MNKPFVQVHVAHVHLDVKVFLVQLCLSMFPTKLSSFGLLSYVTDLCQLLSSLQPLGWALFWVILTASCFIALLSALKPLLRATPPTSERNSVTSQRRLSGHGSFSSFLFFPLWAWFWGHRTEPTGLKPSFHQFTRPSHWFRLA